MLNTDLDTVGSRAIDNRRTTVMKGIKQGAIKGVVDRVVDGMAGPITEAILKNLNTAAPSMKVLEPAVKAAISFIFIMGLAEAMTFMAPMAGKVMPNMDQDNVMDKSKALAQWMRQYAGEKIGEEVITAAVSVFPLIMANFSSISLADINLTLEDEEAKPAQVAETITV